MFEYKELRAENAALKEANAKLQKDLDSTWETIQYQASERYKEIGDFELSSLLRKKLEDLATEIEKLLDDYSTKTFDYPEVESYVKSGKHVVVVKLPLSVSGTRFMSKDNSYGW